MKVLAVESSCDETSVAVIEDGRKVLSNVISSQIDTHKKYGGVVPEIASRQHVESMNSVLEEAITQAGIDKEEIDLVVATKGPGLIGALLVGISAAKAFAYAIDRPFVGVNHIYGHVCANYISNSDLEPPFIGLIVSGGHTYLIKVRDYVDFELVGRTRDDAAGEAFDKVARAMGIGYPGGPIIDKLAKKGEDNLGFPRVMLEEGSYDFSFSGLKTAVINYLHNKEQKGEEVVEEDVAASFQKAVTDVLIEKAVKLAKEEGMDKIVLAGGVAANEGLRRDLEKRAKEENLKVYYPEKILCTDNAAMIASAGYYLYKSGNIDEDNRANPNLGL
ncbi:tRNA (adenosine(37)-N6)-threonylcarbamoyltransferase complex transferase subunit TsaD [Anaerosphaera multitolerans]|uniref:tRNA N6-adenosine threonylcarbamoyltransferase n=1 Tax=Anaerosphaera multitolerans TaxID=2487351 RepID=A0A437S899_9FIRM|nr:tRNA (adenosine(37)-N6)-threonylcarbamoyltransferase complex transferase subunit TsaD [Anaerosphaera multitolerans]RVU55057.1 tRNA (adenosine(37)-N6)-threonylcarbamoyltransferase complex transferase subunit TsaD [Anaerosphaera multitolerans]